MKNAELLAALSQKFRNKLKNGGLIPLSSDEYESMRLRWRNEIVGSMEGDDCPLCKNRGYLVELRNGCQVSVECICMEKRRYLQRMKKSGLGDLLERYTFATYQTTEDWQRSAKRAALDYLQDPGGKWFAATGCVGSGKTHLCTAICSELINVGLEVRYMLWKDDGGRMKAAVNDTEEYRCLVEPMKSVRALYIDDFWKAGNGGVTKGDIDLAFEILNARYNDSHLITIISSELTVGRIMSIDEAVGSRIYERSKGSCLELTGSKNWRLR